MSRSQKTNLKTDTGQSNTRSKKNAINSQQYNVQLERLTRKSSRNDDASEIGDS